MGTLCYGKAWCCLESLRSTSAPATRKSGRDERLCSCNAAGIHNVHHLDVGDELFGYYECENAA
jgi:hypothetical protein